MTTAEELKDIASNSYLVDPLKQDPPVAQGGTFSAGRAPHQQLYEVLATDDNPVNGFQAMAAAPVVNGVPDVSQVVVSYAGTNPEHRADLLADLQSVVDDQSGFGTQVMDAKQFAERVRAEYPGSAISTAGHSLGGYLALLVAAEHRWPATTFNGPDPWSSLSPEARAWLQARSAAGTNPLVNYVNEWDVVGNLYENKTGAAVYVRDRPGRPLLDYHNIGDGESFGFEADGSIVGAGATGHGLNRIVENALDGFAPGLATALGPALLGMVAALRDPGFQRKIGKNLSGLAVAVNTVSALGLAAGIAGMTVALEQIKRSNARLIPRMQEGLTAAMSAAATLPYITAWDIENCVDANRLHVHQNIDENAVAEVDRLVDEHIVLASALAQGISNAVGHAVAQDAQWALTYAGR